MDYRVSSWMTRYRILSKHNLRLLVFWSAGIIAVGFHADSPGQPQGGVPLQTVFRHWLSTGYRCSDGMAEYSQTGSAAARLADCLLITLRRERRSGGLQDGFAQGRKAVETGRVLFADGVGFSDFHALLLPAEASVGANCWVFSTRWSNRSPTGRFPPDMLEHRSRSGPVQLDWRVRQDDRTRIFSTCSANTRQDLTRRGWCCGDMSR